MPDKDFGVRKLNVINGSSGTIPIGCIVMWSGSIATIPTGWALCNGSNGTPDLRKRFIVGAGTDTSNTWSFDKLTGVETFTVSQTSVSVGSTGGSVGVGLTIGELPSHSHSYINGDGSGLAGTSAGFGDSGNSNTTAVGLNLYHENRPPYYALAFIMRVS